MPTPFRLATVLAAAALLTACGTAPGMMNPARPAAAGQVAARDAGFSYREFEYTYKLGNKAAKAFLAAAEKAAAPYTDKGAVCELKPDAGLFGTKIRVKLAGETAHVVPLREALDALYKAHK